ncbi:MAG TPA: hypothetical protein VF895_03740 [Gaiellaceae bacterium]
MSILERIRARLRRRVEGPITPSDAEAKKQDAMSAASTGRAGGAHGNIPPSYVADPVDEGRPRH